MEKDVIVRPYKKGDELEIVPLLESCFKVWPSFDLLCAPLEHWTWKHMDNPYHLHATSVSLHSEKIIGVNHETFQKLKFFDDYYLVAQGVDNAVYPDFRRMGISKKLYDLSRQLCREKGATFSNWDTANPHLIEFALSNPDKYSRYPIPIVHMVKVKDVDAHFKKNPGSYNWMNKIGYKFLSKLSSRFNVRGNFDVEITVRRISNFDPKIEEFWNRVKNDYVHIIERNKEYLDWRYCDHRGGNYFIITADRQEEILGFIVLRINMIRPEYPVGHIVDFLALQEDASAMHLLIQNAITFFDDNNVNIVHYLGVRKSRYQKILESYGFLDSRVQTYIFFSNLKSDNDLNTLRTVSVDKVHFSYGDTDHI